jgi:hypothetical protein
MKDSELLILDGKKYDGFLIIENHDIFAGFCALIVFALNGLRKANAMNLIPVLDFNRENTPDLFDEKAGPLVWDYFFEPLSPYNPQQIKTELQAGRLFENKVHFISKQEFLEAHHYDPERIATFWAWETPENKSQWMKKKRQLGRSYIQKYVFPKQHIVKKANAFCEQHFTCSLVIGVHIRGTDFSYATPFSIETYFEEINTIVRQTGGQDYRIFLATDQQQYLDDFILRFKNKVIYQAVTRSTNHIVPVRFSHLSGYQKGEEALLDMLALARCHHVIKGPAAIGEMALWFNNHNNINDLAIRSEFHKGAYERSKGPYLIFNIDNKTNNELRFYRFKDTLVKKIIMTRVGKLFYTKFDWVRKLLKH